jgi:hypothetical protein
MTFIFNVVWFMFILYNFSISMMSQSYEQVMKNRESITYKFKASLVIKATLVLNSLGFSNYLSQDSIIITKKKFSDDVGERLNKNNW